MAYSPGDLRREIQKIIGAGLAAGRKTNWAWLVTDGLSQHPLPAIPDHDFNITCRRLAVAGAVREVLRDLKLAADDPAKVGGSGTMLLPGFKHLQRGYPVERDGKVEIVPIQLMTNAERRSRAQQYRKMSQGCLAHARELERYEPPAGLAAA